MTIRQIIDLAKTSELKTNGAREDTATVLGYVNLGLLELYKRFPLDTKEVVITMGRDGTVEDPYIQINDTTYQMPSDFQYMIAAYDEVPADSINRLAPIQINNENNLLGINMISWNKVQIPAFVLDAHISLVYAPSPTYFTMDDLDEELPMPIQLVEPLLAYIGYRAFASISDNPQTDVGNVYYARFENSCEIVKQFGIYTAEDMDMKLKFRSRGFA